MADLISDIVGRFGVSGRLDLFHLRCYFIALLNMEPYEKALSDAELVEKLQHPLVRSRLSVFEKDGLTWISQRRGEFENAKRIKIPSF